MACDLISIVEAAYDLEADEREWLVRLLKQAEPRLNRGFGVTISTYAPGRAPDESLVESHKMSAAVQGAMLEMMRAKPALFQDINAPRGQGRCVMAGKTLGMSEVQVHAFGPFVEFMHPVGVRDFFGVLSLDPSGHAIWLGAPTPGTKRPNRSESSAWSRVAAHVTAGARLRRRLAVLASHDVAAGSEAVLSASANWSTPSRAPRATTRASGFGTPHCASIAQGPRRGRTKTRRSSCGPV